MTATAPVTQHWTAEVMALFHSLHESGQTIILVTHEHDIAAHARRQVNIKDGLVDSDTGLEGSSR